MPRLCSSERKPQWCLQQLHNGVPPRRARTRVHRERRLPLCRSYWCRDCSPERATATSVGSGGRSSTKNLNAINGGVEVSEPISISKMRVRHVLISIKALRQSIVSPPPHPFRFRRQLPVVGIEVANQPCLDLCISGVPTVIDRQKLRSIRDLPPPPPVPAAKLPRARWLPKHGRSSL